MSTQTQITCPNCGTEVNINEILYHKLEKDIQEKFSNEVKEHRKKYKDAMQQMKVKETQVKEQEDQFNERLQERLQNQLKIERAHLIVAIKTKIEEEQKDRIYLMEKELEEKSIQVIELNHSKAQVEQLKREKEEITEKIHFESQKELNTLLQSERQKIHKLAQDQNELKLKEKEKQLEDLKQKLNEARHKAEQGSQQSQGEVQELAIEEWLSTKFPFDTLEEIKKGIKEFQRSWIEKFKEDIREKGADLGVLVTEILPKEMERMGMVDGVWICTYDEFKALSFVLRDHIVKLSHSMQSQENKSDKMSILYTYLTSTEFRMQIEAIVEGFTQMQSDLDSEKRALGRIWKQREKQIQKVLDNTVGMYGSIHGIAGNSIGNIEMLELPTGGEEIENEAVG